MNCNICGKRLTSVARLVSNVKIINTSTNLVDKVVFDEPIVLAHASCLNESNTVTTKADFSGVLDTVIGITDTIGTEIPNVSKEKKHRQKSSSKTKEKEESGNA